MRLLAAVDGRVQLDRARAQPGLYLPLQGLAQPDALGPIHRPRQLQDVACVWVFRGVARRRVAETGVLPEVHAELDEALAGAAVLVDREEPPLERAVPTPVMPAVAVGLERRRDPGLAFRSLTGRPARRRRRPRTTWPSAARARRRTYCARGSRRTSPDRGSSPALIAGLPAVRPSRRSSAHYESPP